jgi:hypothetical protein
MNPNKYTKKLDQSAHNTLEHTQQYPPTYDVLYLSEEDEASVKAEFYESGCQSAPDLRPRNLNIDSLEDRIGTLKGVKSEILNDPKTTPEIKQIYRWKVNEEIANLKMLVAATSGNSRSFDRWNKFIYGEINPEIFASVCTWYRNLALESLSSERPEIKESAYKVLELVPGVYNNPDILSPDETTFKKIKEQQYKSHGFLTLLLAGVELDAGEIVKPAKGNVMLRRMLDNIGAQNSAIVDSKGSSWSASHNPSQVARPVKYSIPAERFIGLTAHEASHLVEAIEGATQPVELLKEGLDRNESGNEGRALIREQVIYSDFDKFTKLVRWQDIMRRYTAIGLATGVSGDKLDFPHVYEIINSMDRLMERSKNKDTAIADSKADNRTWNLLNRVLKGTDGKGGAYYKDKVYLEGNIACWNVLKKSPNLMEVGDLGKFDITNPRHIQLLIDAGILPNLDLEEIDEDK